MERVKILGLGASVFTLLCVCGLFAAALAVYVVLGFMGRRPRSAEMAARGETLFLPMYVREYWDWTISPVTHLLIRWRVDPNAITWASFFIAAGAGAALAYGYFGLGGWLYILAGTCDMFDGKVARATGSASKTGAFVDSTLDRYTEIFVMAGLAYHFKESKLLWAALAALAGSLMVSYTRARGEGLGFSCREGGMQRAERIVYLGLAGVFGKLAEALMPGRAWSVGLMAVAVVLLAVSTNVTAIQRFFTIQRALREQELAERGGAIVRHPATRARHPQ